MPSVSVLIPAYNSASYIRRSIDSVLNQSLLPLEIIVIDDGSTDATAAIAISYGGIVRVITKGINCGLPAARNFGIKNAAGEWVAFLDSDDEWEPRKQEMAVAAVELHKTDWCMVARKEVRDNTYLKYSDAAAGKMICMNYFSLVLQGKGCAPSSAMIRKSVFQRVGGFNETLTTGEDQEMWWRIATVTPKISYYSQPLVRYYVNVAGSMSNSSRNESKLVAFWDSVTQIPVSTDDPDNSKLFMKVRNATASKAVRFYLRAGYFNAVDHLRKKTMITFNPLARLLLMLPKSFSRAVLQLMNNFRIGFLLRHTIKFSRSLFSGDSQNRSHG